MTLRVEYRISSADSGEPVADRSLTAESRLAVSRKRSRWINRWAAPLLLFLGGCLALGYYAYDIVDAHIFQENQSRQFDEALRDANSGNTSAAATKQTPADELHAEVLAEMKAKSASGSAPPSPAIPNFEESTGADASTGSLPEKKVGATGNIPLGRIQIAAIGLTAMIQEGTAAQTLQRGVGHITGTAALGQAGNVGLAAHRDTFFRKLRDIHEGDEITLTTLVGTFVYRVELISIVEPQDSGVLRDSGGNILTLVTCYPFSYVGPAPKRFIVRARQMQSASTIPTNYAAIDKSPRK